MFKHSRDKGAVAEDAAISYLVARNMSFLARNIYYRGGEIDLVMSDNSTSETVFVEVKSSNTQIDPLWQITPRKMRHLRQTIWQFLRRNPGVTDYRLDVLIIWKGKVEWFRNFRT